MRPLESLPRQFQIWLTTGLLLAATMATLDGEIRLRLPFDIFPGAAYLALLSLPAFAERSDRPDGETDAQLGVYLGPAYTSESDLNLAQPGGTDMTFRDIAWEGKPPAVLRLPGDLLAGRSLWGHARLYPYQGDRNQGPAGTAIRLQGWRSRAAASAGLRHAQAA